MSCASEEHKETNTARCALKYNLPLNQTFENMPSVPCHTLTLSAVEGPVKKAGEKY